MKTHVLTAIYRLRNFGLAALLAFPGPGLAEALSPMVDDFSDPLNNSLGIARQFLDDTMAGGSTTTSQSVSEGVLSVKGDIVPPRGQPGWASSVLLLDPQGLPQDASAFEGIRLLVRVNNGNISVSANSTEVDNFDYHAAPVVATKDGDFHEVRIPFATMKRAWSEQTSLDTTTISSLSIVAYGVQKGSFDFELDEVSFY